MNQKKLTMAAVELFDRLSAAWWIPALLMRLFVGYFFMETGWGKLHNLDGFAQRFAGWGIPYRRRLHSSSGEGRRLQGSADTSSASLIPAFHCGCAAREDW